jgi:hypothetical protein
MRGRIGPVTWLWIGFGAALLRYPNERIERRALDIGPDSLPRLAEALGPLRLGTEGAAHISASPARRSSSTTS